LKSKIFPLFAFIVGSLACIYFHTGPLTLPEADSGEFAILAKHGGVAHPPGFPLYVALSMAAAKLSPPLPYIQALSLVSVVSGALAAGIFFLTLSQIVGAESALIAVLVTFLTSGVWRSATSIEPFGLNLLLISFVIYSSWLTLSSRRRVLPLFLLGLSFGLGACNHHALVFYLPIAVGAIIARFFFNKSFSFSSFFGGAGGFFIGLLPLLYFCFTPENPPISWGKITSVGSLVKHLIREDYGTFSLTMGNQGSGQDMLRYFWSHVPSELSWIFFPVFLLGFHEVYRRPSAFAVLSIVILLSTGVVFFGMFNVPIFGTGTTIAYRFFHVALLPMAVLLALSLSRLEGFFSSKPAALALAALTLVIHGFTQFPSANRRQEQFAETDTRNTFQLISQSSRKPLLVTFFDAEYLGALYGKYILSLNDKVEVLNVGMWGAPWYRSTLTKNLSLPASDANRDWNELFPQFISKFDVYLTSKNAGVESFLKYSYPYGRLIRLVPTAKEVPGEREIFELNTRLFAYEMTLPSYPLTAWESRLFSRYVMPLHRFSEIHRSLPHERPVGFAGIGH
jgi:hypothetical protein